MCLAIIDKKYKRTYKGYKIFYKSKLNKISTYSGLYYNYELYEIGKQYIAKVQLLKTNYKDKTYYYDYFSGFHIYPRLKEARKIFKNYSSSCVLCLVEYMDVFCEGTQDNFRVVVAGSMTIIKEVK